METLVYFKCRGLRLGGCLRMTLLVLLDGIVEISGSMCDYLAPASSAGVMEVIAPLGRSDL